MTNVIPYRVGPDRRYSLEFVTLERDRFMERLAERTMSRGTSFKSREFSVETDEGGSRTLYAIYSNSVPVAVLEDESFDDEELERILDEVYTDDQLQVLAVIADIYVGIVGTVESETGTFEVYKDSNLQKIPDILRFPDWGEATVTEVGGQLLSRFILGHPMPNANHRTSIGLLERYLQSMGDQLTAPDTGEHGVWYEWARPYIRDSKRLLTVRRNAHLFRHASKYGVDVVERKNGVEIELPKFDLDVDDPLGHFGQLHEDRSIEFVKTILEQTDVDTQRFAMTTDPGWEAFVEALRSD